VGSTTTHVGLARLRRDLVIVRRSDQAEIHDPLTLRTLTFDDMQMDVLSLFDGEHTPESIAEEVFGDATQIDAVCRLIDRVHELGLLESARLDRRALASAQARALREPARGLRDQRVAATVRWAAREIPLYEERIGALAGEVHGVADLVKLPVTTKQDVRDHFPARLIARGASLNELLERREVGMVTSSGSTGGRLEFLYYDGDPAPPALYLRHPAMRAAGEVQQIKIANFTTPICSGAVCHRASPLAQRMFDRGRQVSISSSERIMQLRRSELDLILDELTTFKPDVLFADPVYAVALVRALQREGLAIPQVKAVFTSYDFLTTIHAAVLRESFGLPVYQMYGASEINDNAAFTCDHGRFHVLDERSVFEFLRAGRPVRPGEVGAITVTLVSRPYSRFVRYQVGDLARPIEDCGCAFDDLQAFELEGRMQEVLFTTRGEPVTTRGVDRLFEGLRWIDFYQLVQRDRSRFELLAVRRDGVDGSEDERTLRERVRETMGKDAELEIVYVRELPVNPSLKYPPTVNKTTSTWQP